MTLRAKSSISSAATWEVIEVLKNQIELARLDQALIQGRLEYFRQAIVMRNFHVVVAGLKEILGCHMFSTIQELESIEDAIRKNDRSEVIAQFCMILHFCETVGCLNERFPNPEREHVWLFEPYDSLEEIAYTRSRLHFVRHSSYVRKAINFSLIRAVRRCFLVPKITPRWPGLLLIFRESRPFCVYRLLKLLRWMLRDGTEEVPGEAATLFLSYSADAIYFLTAHIGNYVSPFESKLIESLFKLGASPMISRENHQVLFERLKDRLRTDRSPWWAGAESLTLNSARPYPTALKRILAHEWSPEFLEQLSRYTCCSLDANEIFKRNYNVKKVPSLQCLASHALRESDLCELSPHLRFIAKKHQPSSFSLHFGRS